MKESETLVVILSIQHLIKDIWLNTKGQYMKESNTLAVIVTIKQLQKEIWLNTID